MPLRLKIDGIRELERQLKELAGQKVATKILRSAATAAIRPMRKAAKDEVPVVTGASKKAIDSSIRNRGLHVSARVGEDPSIVINTETGEKRKLIFQEKVSSGEERPARYLHLILFGHITEAGQAVPGNDFLTRAFDDSQAQCLSIYESKAKEGIEKAVDETK